LVFSGGRAAFHPLSIAPEEANPMDHTGNERGWLKTMSRQAREAAALSGLADLAKSPFTELARVAFEARRERLIAETLFALERPFRHAAERA
jgi:hypothetical protein